MIAFLPVPTVHRGLMPLKRPSASMGSIGRGPLQCLGGFGKQLSAPSNICSRPAGVPTSSLSMSLIDPGLIAASVGIGAVLWLLVESYESCPVGHVPDKVMESIQVRFRQSGHPLERTDMCCACRLERFAESHLHSIVPFPVLVAEGDGARLCFMAAGQGQ
jgi:hypothetical protein